MSVQTTKSGQFSMKEKMMRESLDENGMTPEIQAHKLLELSYRQPPADIFSPTATPALLELGKLGADLLVDSKLASFADEGRTQIILTGAGRYWALHGGYLAFLKEEPAGRGGRNRNPELEELRLQLTKRRLGTFWWSFALSLAGFIISIISLTVAFIYGYWQPK